MPAADRVGRDEGRQTFSDWSQALEDREHPSLLGSEPWPGHLSAKYVELLAQDQQLEVFGPGRATPEQEQAKDLSETDSGETEGHGVIVAVRREDRRGGRSACWRADPRVASFRDLRRRLVDDREERLQVRRRGQQRVVPGARLDELQVPIEHRIVQTDCT
jgi:hypothetical protein